MKISAKFRENFRKFAQDLRKICANFRNISQWKFPKNSRKFPQILRKFPEIFAKFCGNFHTIFYNCFSLNRTISANIYATRMKHISFCSQEQGGSIYLRNILVKNRSVPSKSRAKLKNGKKLAQISAGVENFRKFSPNKISWCA